MSKKPIVGITMGDPAGNGPEITIKALAHKDVYDRCQPVVVGDANMLEQAKGFVNMPEIRWRYGYLSVIIAAVLIAVAEIIYFKKKKFF